MQGRRIPVTDPKVDPYTILKELGDYYGPVMGFTGDRPAVFFYLPVYRKDPNFPLVMGHVQSPPHTFTEEADGSLTIRNSILTKWQEYDIKEYYEKEWHGYLTKGVWEKC